MGVIEASGLRRAFATKKGTVEAVRGVSFAVEAGEIVGFLGPNGAGKTTTQRMLTTLLPPTAGSARIVGYDLRRQSRDVRRHIGYVPQGGGTKPTASVREELVLQGRLYRMSRAASSTRADELIADLGLDGTQDRPTMTLSGGQRRRVDVALGLIHRPDVLFLDEPSAGLDPQSRLDLWAMIAALRAEQGMTVFLSTHYLEEADALCDRVMIIDRGRVVAQDSPAHLKEQLAHDVVVIEVDSDVHAARAALAGRDDVLEVSAAGTTLKVTCERGDRLLTELLRALDRAGATVRSIRLERPSLDDVFLAATDSQADATAPVGSPNR
jgi:ABC-2 type transport system ATP-binding protein